MTRMEKVESDLLYVRSALDRAEATDSPPSIYFLWAAVSLVGFALYDFRPALAPAYWSVAGPAGGVASFFLGWRWCRRAGVGSMRTARHHALHWSGMLAAIFLLVPLRLQGLLEDEGLARAILIVLTLGYFTAGIYLVRGFLWISLVMAAGYVALFFFESYTWTATGLLLAVSLGWAGARGVARDPSRD